MKYSFILKTIWNCLSNTPQWAVQNISDRRNINNGLTLSSTGGGHFVPPPPPSGFLYITRKQF